MIVDDEWVPTPEEMKRAYTCDGCGRILSGGGLIDKPCPTGDCTQTVCAACGHQWASVGPVLCRSCGDMNWRERQIHRLDLWWFDLVTLPLHSLRRRFKR